MGWHEHEHFDRRQPVVGHHRPVGKDRHRPAWWPQATDADRRRQADARPVRRLGEGCRLRAHRRPRSATCSCAAKARDASLPPVVIGSHLDTQAAGGRFDGILGVLGGPRSVAHPRRPAARDAAVDRGRQLDQRGGRAVLSADDVLAGVRGRRRRVDWANDRQDKDGRRFGDELARIGYAGAAPVGGRALDSYFELHIEQGPKLDAARLQGRRRHRRLPDHAACASRSPARPRTSVRRPWRGGTTRSSPRSHVAVAIDDIGWRYAHAEAKTTAARLDLWPNLPGIISERATLFCDLRHPDPAELEKMVAEIETALPDCARRGRCDDRNRRALGLRRHGVRCRPDRAGPRGGGDARPPDDGHRVRSRPRQLPRRHRSARRR